MVRQIFLFTRFTFFVMKIPYISKNDNNAYRVLKNKVYNNIYEVKENVVTSFQPIFIKQPECDRLLFSERFSCIEPKKRNFLYKFANLHDHYKLLYDITDLEFLKSLSLGKLKSLFKIASIKDSTGMLRFSPSELMYINSFDEATLRFIKPFARLKNADDIFYYRFGDIKKLAAFTQEERKNAVQLFEYPIDAQNFINICKDKDADILTLKKRLSIINNLFLQNIYKICIDKYNKGYLIRLITENDHKIHTYVFDRDFNLNPDYKSNIDFETGKMRKPGFLKRLNIFSAKQPVLPEKPSVDDTFKCSDEEHFEVLDKINETAEYLKSLCQKMYKHNFYVINTGQGNIIDTNIKFPSGMLVNYFKTGAISNTDLIRICSENIGLIPNSDFKYFALNKIPITSFDNERYLEVRKLNAMSKPVEIGSEYYNNVLKKVLKSETEKLKDIKSGKRMIIISGLPGAGKSTIVNSILKNDKNLFYTPDADDIKTAFTEVYKNGEGAQLVHKASGKILKSELLPQVFEKGKNIIYQTTGSYVSIDKIIHQAKNYGYMIDFIQVPTQKNLSLERAVTRFQATGRFMDPAITISRFNNNNKEVLDSAKIFSHNPNINSAYLFENGKLYEIKEGNRTGVAIKL